MMRPDKRFDRLENIPESEYETVKVILIDLDNTVAPWRAETVSEDAVKWVKKAKENGKRVFLCTNSHGENVDKVAEKLGIETFKSANKPFASRTKKLLENLSADAKEVLVIGDQLFTDISLAHKIGAKSILTQPLDKREWWCTKVFNRTREKLVWKFIFKE